MRGKGPRPFFEDMETRITPAYAGKRCSQRLELVSIRDHPRLCGEKCVTCQLEMLTRGSPPPMRGKGPPVADMWKRSGITPAYAGKSRHCRLHA